MADSNIIQLDLGTDSPKGAGVDSGDGYDYDRQCDLMRERNERFLTLFESDMRTAGLAESTIRKHLDNVDFYLNVYLLHYDVNQMESGCYDIDGFLGDFFIRKCMWSTPGTIKTNAASIKKFYKCMRDNGLVSANAYDELVRTVKENMADWQADCAAFNDPGNYDNPFFDDYPFGANDTAGGVGEEINGFIEFSHMFAGDPELEGYFKDALKEILQERLVEVFGDKLDEAAIAAYNAAAADGQFAPAEAEPPSREVVVQTLTLALFYLTSWEERIGGKGGLVIRRAWKSADWDALDALQEAGFVSFTNKAKSVTITADGADEAQKILRMLGLSHLAE